jgi:hypothetical protein
MVLTKNGKIFEPVIDFWIPQNKTGLLNYLTTHFPQNAQKFFGMKKNRLMAIYLNTRKRVG